MAVTTTKRNNAQRIASGTLLAAVAVGGVLTLLYFWNQLLKPGDLSSNSLPIVALIAGIAATFNPCGLPALLGFLTFLGGGEDVSPNRRMALSLSVSIGEMTLVIALGIVVAVLGSGTKDLISPNVRWVQLVVGSFLVSLTLLHLTGQTSRLPLVGHIMGLGSRVWEGAMGGPSLRSSDLFGAGFVLVGVG